MKNVEQHIEKLWKLNNCDLKDMEDIQACMNTLNIQYGVHFKLSTELPDDDYEYCINNFSGDVEETFLDKINTKNISYYDFQRFCQLYMDFSKMYSQNISQSLKKEPTELFNTIAKIVQESNETKFGLIHK